MELQEILPFWKKITKEQQDKLTASCREVTYKKGEVLHAGTGDCSGLFAVKEGRLRSYIISEGGKEITLYRLFERDVCIFSASCIMKNISFDVFVEAEKDTKVYLIPSSIYAEMQKESLPIAEYTNELLSSRMSDVMWIMEQILFMSFDKRLAIFLLEQAEIEGEDTFKMTQDKIARHLGSAREVVSRMLKYFADEGLVDAGRGSVTLLDKKKLRKLAY